MNSLVEGVSAGLIARILAALGPRYVWAVNVEPVRIVARMLAEEQANHRVTRAALQVLQDTRRAVPGPACEADGGPGGLLSELVSLLLSTSTPIGPMRDRRDYPPELRRAIDYLHRTTQRRYAPVSDEPN